MTDLNDDITRYLSGRMTPAEMHALEKRALDDPFLADAMAGGESIPEAAFSEDVNQLQSLLSERAKAKPTGALLEGTTPGRGKQVSMWTWPMRIAAGLLLVVSAGVVLFFISDKPANELALNTSPKSVDPPNSSLQEPTTDSISLEHVPAAADAAGDADDDLKQRTGVEALPDNEQPAAPAPAVEPALREQIAAAPSSKGAVSPKPGHSRDDKGEAVIDLEKDKRDTTAPVGRLDGYASAVESSKAFVRKSADTATEIVPEAEITKAESSESITANDSLINAENTRSRTEIAAANRDEAAKRTAEEKVGEASREASKKEVLSKKMAAQATIPGEATDGKQVFSGKVVDSDGTGIPGVNVVIKGTNTGTVTDIQGNYQLAVPDSKPTLVYTFIGYANLEQVADASQPATIALEEDLTQLSEVVVAGYGAQRSDEPVTPVFDFAYPAGGKRAFKQYLEKNLQYPKEALLNQVEGRVTIQFSVETTGSLSDFRVVKGIGNGCDEEVIRLIKTGPKWNPTKRDEVAEKSTIKVRMRFQLPKEKKK